MLVTTLFSPKIIELLKPVDFVGLKPNGDWSIFIIPWVETHGYAVKTHGNLTDTRPARPAQKIEITDLPNLFRPCNKRYFLRYFAWHKLGRRKSRGRTLCHLEVGRHRNYNCNGSLPGQKATKN